MKIIVIFFFIYFTWSPLEAIELPYVFQTILMINLISYNENINEIVKDNNFNIGILHDKKYAASEQDFQGLQKQGRALKEINFKIENYNFNFYDLSYYPIDFDRIENVLKKEMGIMDRELTKKIGDEIIEFKKKELAYLLQTKNINALYITSGYEESIPEIVEITQGLKILSIIGHNVEQNVKNGVSIGLRLKYNKPNIFVNLDSTYREGWYFNQEFVNLAGVELFNADKAKETVKQLAIIKKNSLASGNAQKEEPKLDKKKINQIYLNGVGYYLANKIKEAITEWELILKEDPNNEQVKISIQKARIKLKSQGKQ